MRNKWGVKILSMLLILATLTTMLPMSILADEIRGTEIYMKSVKIAQAKTREEAKGLLESEGYIFLDRNLNEGTGADGIWIGYTTTTDPSEAIYDIKLMNTKGGYTLTSMEAVLDSQQSMFAQMAEDLNNLVEEFVSAYNEGSVPAQKAYQALNFFRVVDGEKELSEENGLGYQIVNGNMTFEKLTNMILFCDGAIFDSVVKLLTMGVQVRTENWMSSLSALGKYDSEKSYGDDEAELKRRAKQMLVVLQHYAQTYNAMEAMGLVSGKFDDQGNIDTDGVTSSDVSASQADLVKADMDRVKSYKLVFDELAKYSYGTGTLKDFFCSLENERDEKVLYPLASVLTDGEFAALSYGCFIELALGADAKSSDFENYDEAYAEATKDVKSLYLYMGVNSALLDDDAVIGFTDEASRHMALTGEYQFYEKESWGEDVWETGRNAAIAIGATGMIVMAASKFTLGMMSWFGVLSAATAKGATGMLAGLAKVCAVAGGGYTTLIALAIAAVVAIVTYVIYVIDEKMNNTVNWEKNPIPEYIYDVQEVGFVGASKNEGIEADYIKRPTFVFYEAVRDVMGKAADLNARSSDSAQWIAMYVSYDRPGDDSKPIKAEDFIVNNGNGETPKGYTPAARFGEVRAYNLNQWDDRDDVNGVYMFYSQDQKISMSSDRTQYIYEIQLQSGESTAHCISLLEAAGYTPININLSPDYETAGLFGGDPVFTYLGYKVTDNPDNAITDLRVEYGTAQGTVQLGGVTYANCGSSAGVTLYATKYKAAGTPLLAGGLMCVNDRDDAPAGYEPVNFLAGGPAVSFNTANDGVKIWSEDYFIYFLPETTFTSGRAYLGGISYHYYEEFALKYDFLKYSLNGRDNNKALILAYLKKCTGEDWSVSTEEEGRKALEYYAYLRSGYHMEKPDYAGNFGDSVYYYKTYNPYRAIYAVKGTALDGISNLLTVEGQGFVKWNIVWWSGHYYESDTMIYSDYNFSFNVCQGESTPLDMSANLYVAGNPSKNNVYNAATGKMSETQPIDYEGLICMYKETADLSYSDLFGNNSDYITVTDIFSNAKDPLVVRNNSSEKSYRAEFVFCYQGYEEERPYVSAITAIDKLTIFRASGGSDSGLKREDITNNMLLAQLSKQGATNFSEIDVSMFRELYWTHALIQPESGKYNEMNTIKFGYTRTAEATAALRDVFIYVNGFSTDDPPREMYRGKVKYTLLCELSGNLTGYDEAPAPGVYLYGTTDKRAGERIIDVEFSDTPFKDGYVTVRTLNGRSMWAEIVDYMTAQQNNHFMSGAKTLFKALAEFFGFKVAGDKAYYDTVRAQKYYYIHIKREGDDLATQKPYVSELYLSTSTDLDTAGSKVLIRKGILDDLFDQGAEALVDFNLNEGVLISQFGSAQLVYLGYSYTADPDDAITNIRADHSKTAKTNPILDGVQYHLVSKTSLNVSTGGDTIYLYYTKSQEQNAGTPITDIRHCVNTVPASSTTDTANIVPVMRWDSETPSDLNAGTGKTQIYLTAVRPFATPDGTYKAPSFGDEKTTTRKTAAGSAEGKYIAALYVMDKNTIRREKLEAGVPSDECTCAKITDQEVIDRLKAMGATTVLSTPICITGGEYGKNNQNKVFIGYSRTDNYSKAIKNIAIKAEVLSLKEPDEYIEINKKEYTLVAEAAKKVTTLPRAINLIGTEDGQDLLIPRLYLYTSTVGQTEPIYDICLDSNPLKTDWVTVMTENKVAPYIDIYQQAKKQAELGDKDDDDSYDHELVYTDELYKWMENVADMFNPAKEKVSPFFIHCKKFEGTDLKTTLPYIGEVFLAAGDTKLEALSKLVAYGPDGYIDYDLNKGAGGDYIYLAYKRTNAKSEAITDLAILNHAVERVRVVFANGKYGYYDLVDPMDLNQGVVYAQQSIRLYATKSREAGSGAPISDLYIKNKVTTTKQKGFFTERTAKYLDRVSGADYYVVDDKVTGQHDPDLNDGVGGAYIYLVMKLDPAHAFDLEAPGAMIGSGSIVAICVLLGVGTMFGLAVIYIKRKKKE